MAASHSQKRPRRSRGEGSIYETADGRIRGALTVVDPATGRETRKVVSGRSRAEVSRKLAKLRQDASAGAIPSSTTVADYLTGWLEGERSRLRLGTWRQREVHVRLHIIPAIGSIQLGRLVPGDVERMINRVTERGLSPRTASHVRVTLRRALGDAQRDGLVSRNVAALARPPRVPSRSMEAGRDYLTPAQLKTLLVKVEDHPLGSLITVAATTGLRQGELLALSWSDLDLEGRTLTVRRSLARAWLIQEGRQVQGWALQEPKTPRSRRTIHLPATAILALEQHRAAQRARQEAAGSAWQDVDNLVFTDALGRPLHPSTVGHEFPLMLSGAGLPHIPFHGLRHSAATAWLAAGVPLRTVADQLGHSTITITADTYAAVVPELRREAADAMDRVLSEGPAT